MTRRRPPQRLNQRCLAATTFNPIARTVESMNNFQVSPNSAKGIVTTAAKIAAPPAEVVTEEYLKSGCSLPLVITPTTAGVDLIDWARSNR